jgi:hypothetical protein
VTNLSTLLEVFAHLAQGISKQILICGINLFHYGPSVLINLDFEKELSPESLN